MKKFEENGTLCDRRTANSGRRRSGRCEETIDEVMDIVAETDQTVYQENESERYKQGK